MNEARKILDEAESDAHAAEAHARNAAMHSTLAREQIDKARAALESVPEREAKWLAYRDAVVDLLARCDGLAMPNGQLNRLMGTVRAADPLADRPKEKKHDWYCASLGPAAGDKTCDCIRRFDPAPDPKLAEGVKALIVKYESDGVTDYARVRAAELRDFYRRVFAAELG